VTGGGRRVAVRRVAEAEARGRAGAHGQIAGGGAAILYAAGEAPLGAPVASCTTETAYQLPVAAVLCQCECESTLPPPAPPPLAPPRVARWPAP